MISIRQFLVLLALLSGCQFIYAQTGVLSGKVTDKYAGESLPTANVFVNEGTAVSADLDGNYSIELPYGTHSIEFSFVGYVSLIKQVVIDKAEKKLDIQLISIELEEAEVYADIAIDRDTPVAFSNIDAKTVEEELASQDIPMLLNTTPGVYATQQGGGDGDARITIRGFSQRNIAVMLDGVPVNDMENGQVFWSNWFGLDAIMQTTQVQRGLGVSKIAIPSVGGTINIVTKGIEQKKNTRIKQEYGSNGFFRTTIGHTSGRLPGDWGYTLAGSYKQGNGWVNGNWTQGYFYYGKVQKSVGNHVFTISGFGAPQSHGQRSFRQGAALYNTDYAVDQGVELNAIEANNPLLLNQGLNYNITATTLERYELNENGEKINSRTEEFNASQNFYHKPQFSLRHSWSANDKFSLNTTAYLSIGNGGGTGLDDRISENSLDENGVLDLQTTYDRQTGFEQVQFVNNASIEPSISETENVAFENYVQANINNHFWYGVLSSAKYNASEKLTYSGGVDVRAYKGEHYREIFDLLGADYAILKNNVNSPTVVHREGDIIDFHNDSFVQWAGLFGQVEYKNTLFSSFFSVSAATTRYKRIDYMKPKSAVVNGVFINPVYEVDSLNPAIVTPQEVIVDGVTYTPDSDILEFEETDWFVRSGFTLKTGANYKFSERSNAFINIGYLDRAPRFRNIFDFDNDLFLDIQNEKIKSIEFGYGYKSSRFSSNLNGYLTIWQNRPVNQGISIPDPEDPTEFISANINEMDARHAGIELETAFDISDKLTIENVISIGDWIWNSADTVFFVDNNNNIINNQDGTPEQRAFDAIGVHVGDAAQTQIGFLLRYQYKPQGYLKLRYTFFDRYFADFDPLTLNGADAGRDSWKLPSYGLLELHTGYGFSMSNNKRLDIRASLLNLANNIYISDAQNNANNGIFTENDDNFDAGAAEVYFGQGRRFNLSVTLSF